MTKSINAALLGLLCFLTAYCLCFWFGVMPKFYPLLGELHVTPPAGSHIAVKFVGSAMVGFVAGVVGFVLGRRLPEKVSSGLHIAAWSMMILSCVYLVSRETIEYILK